MIWTLLDTIMIYVAINIWNGTFEIPKFIDIIQKFNFQYKWKVAWRCKTDDFLSFSMKAFLSFKMASGGHLGFVEFIDFDKCNTDTRVIPLIPQILGWQIRFWC